jgi:hypothetical protein
VRIGIRGGVIVTAGAPGLVVAHLVHTLRASKYVEVRTAEEAKAHGDTFGGCDTARKAARHIYKVFGRLSLDDALSVSLDDLIAAIGDVEPRGRWCVATVLQAVRRAIIDVRARILAEEIVESRHSRLVG